MNTLKMKTSKITTMAAAVALLALGATQAFADGVNGGSVNGSVTVTVDNTVTVTETQPVQFGSMVIITDGASGPIDVVMTAAGAVTWPGVLAQAAPWVPDPGGAADIAAATKARAFPTGGGAARTGGIITITGVALGASMGIIFNNTAINNMLTVGGAGTVTMTCGACAVGAEPAMEFGSITPAAGAGDTYAAGIGTDTDGDGDIVINLGGTLRTANTVNSSNLTGSSTAVVGALEDGVYSGVFVVSAIY